MPMRENSERMGSGRDGFLERVAERANLPYHDAADIVDEVLRELAKVLDRESWTKIQEILPFEVDIEPSGQPLSIEESLMELSRDEPVRDERAAIHARAVAGTIGETASESQLEELSALIEDDTVLALFEERRGELTNGPRSERWGAGPAHPAHGRSRAIAASPRSGLSHRSRPVHRRRPRIRRSSWQVSLVAWFGVWDPAPGIAGAVTA